MSRRRHPFVPTIAWALVVGLASVTPPGVLWTSSTGVGLHLTVLPRFDLFLHLLGYAILAGLAIHAAGTRVIEPARRRAHVFLLGVFAATAFGLGIEGLQYVLPYRNASLVDATVNGIGAILGALLAAVAPGRRPGPATPSREERE